MSSAGTARGPLIGHFGTSRRASAAGSTCATSTWRRFSIEPSGRRGSPGRRTSRDFIPAEIDLNLRPHVEGFGYQAANVRAQGVYDPRAAFDASAAAYGAAATTRATFPFRRRRGLCRIASKGRSAISICGVARASVDAEARDAGRRRIYVRGTGARLDRANAQRRGCRGRHFAPGMLVAMQSVNGS